MRVEFSRLRFLVVDDHAPTRRILCAMLTGFGSQTVAEAGNGEEGLKAFLSQRPDIVVMDWDLPLIDGPALTRLLRDESTSPDPFVPVIMLTGQATRRRVSEARAAGVHELLLKPVIARALAERILSVVAAPRPFLRSGSYFGPVPRGAGRNPSIPEDRGTGPLMPRTGAPRADPLSTGRAALAVDRTPRRGTPR